MTHKRVLILLILLVPTLLAFGPSGGPELLTWNRLKDVQFKKKWCAEEGVVMLYPRFGPTVKSLQGKFITISGYVIPIDLESGLYVVSKFPVAACFFCGGAGPESIMMLKFKQLTRRFKTDERRSFSGTLRLNAENIYELNYILEGADLLPGNP